MNVKVILAFFLVMFLGASTALGCGIDNQYSACACSKSSLEKALEWTLDTCYIKSRNYLRGALREAKCFREKLVQNYLKEGSRAMKRNVRNALETCVEKNSWEKEAKCFRKRIENALSC